MEILLLTIGLALIAAFCGLRVKYNKLVSIVSGLDHQCKSICNTEYKGEFKKQLNKLDDIITRCKTVALFTLVAISSLVALYFSIETIIVVSISLMVSLLFVAGMFAVTVLAITAYLVFSLMMLPIWNVLFPAYLIALCLYALKQLFTKEEKELVRIIPEESDCDKLSHYEQYLLELEIKDAEADKNIKEFNA